MHLVFQVIFFTEFETLGLTHHEIPPIFRRAYMLFVVVFLQRQTSKIWSKLLGFKFLDSDVSQLRDFDHKKPRWEASSIMLRKPRMESCQKLWSPSMKRMEIFWPSVLLLARKIRRSPVEVGSLSRYLQGFKHLRWLFGTSSINSGFQHVRSWVSLINIPPKLLENWYYFYNLANLVLRKHLKT